MILQIYLQRVTSCPQYDMLCSRTHHIGKGTCSRNFILSSRLRTVTDLSSDNELCQNTNQDCVILYDASVIAAAFKWTLFDGIAFLIGTNRGFRTTILEMAAHIKNAPDSSAMATVTCDDHQQRDLSNQTDPCVNPNFNLNRNAIIIPGMNQTAAQVYRRMGKDCGVVSCYTISPFCALMTGLRSFARSIL